MKTRPIPAIIMLIAGFIACVFGIIQHLEMEMFLKTVLISMIVFLIIGQGVRIVLDRNIGKMADKKEEAGETETASDAEMDVEKESDGEKEE